MTDRSARKSHEYGPVKKWETGAAVAISLASSIMAALEMLDNNIGGVAVFMLFAGLWLGLSVCSCKITKRREEP